MSVNKGKIIVAALLVCLAALAVYAVYQVGRNTSLSYELRLAQMEIEDAHERLDAAELAARTDRQTLADVRAENADLRRQVRRQEGALDALRRTPQRNYWHAQHVRLADGRYLRYAMLSFGFHAVEYIHILESGSHTAPYTVVFDIGPYGMVSQPSISPCGNLLTFAQPSDRWESGSLMIYDMRTGEVQSIHLVAHWDNLRSQTGISRAVWLDERTILVLIQFRHGTPVRGGTVYAFDIVDNTLTSVDIPIPETGRQIFSMWMEGDVLYMDIFRPIEWNDMILSTFPHHIYAAEIHRLIAAGETRPVGYIP